MKHVLWERDCAGNTASIHFGGMDYISPPGGIFLVKNLMHEITTMSARFDRRGLIVFSRMVGISVFNDSGGVHYGLYGAGLAPEDSPQDADYCIRLSTWKSGFQTIENVLNGLSSVSLFFRTNQLSDHQSQVINSIEKPLIDNPCVVRLLPVDEKDSKDKIYFHAQDYSTKIVYEYYRSVATNAYVESIFDELGKIFESLSATQSIHPKPGSLRISYSFNNFKFIAD